MCAALVWQVESKIDSAGLALWADIEQPPGSLPPDCVDFLQQALAKDPRQRPSAEQLQEHPWLARWGFCMLLPLVCQTHWQSRCCAYVAG